MMVGGRFQYETALVKEGAMFLHGDESIRVFLIKGDLDRGGSSAFFFRRSWTAVAAI